MNNTPGTAEPAGTPAPKPRPTLARLREAMTALGVHGTCRLVGFELASYWRPGGLVFPAVRTLADGLGVEPRTVQTHLVRLERIGLWVRIGRSGQTNLYEMRLPADKNGHEPMIAEAEPLIVGSGGSDRRITKPLIVGSAPPGSDDHPEVTNEVTKKVQAAAVVPAAAEQQQRIEGMLGVKPILS